MANLSMGIVGEKDAVIAFRALGMEIKSISSKAQVGIAINQLIKQGIRVIFITEKAAKMAEETVDMYRRDPQVILVPIPGTTGTDGYSMDQIKKNVEKAIGANILLDQDDKQN